MSEQFRESMNKLRKIVSKKDFEMLSTFAMIAIINNNFALKRVTDIRKILLKNPFRVMVNYIKYIIRKYRKKSRALFYALGGIVYNLKEDYNRKIKEFN